MAISIGGGFRITDNNPIDDRFVVSSSDARFNIPFVRVFEGLTVYARSSDEYWILGDKDNWNNENGWHKVLIGGLGGGLDTLALSESLYVSGSTFLSGSTYISGNFEITGLISQSTYLNPDSYFFQNTFDNPIHAYAITSSKGIKLNNAFGISGSNAGAGIDLKSDIRTTGVVLSPSGDIHVSRSAYISSSVYTNDAYISNSLTITEISPYAVEGGVSGSFFTSESGISDLVKYSGSIFIVSTSLEDERGLSSYEFHVTSSPIPDDRPENGVWYFVGEGVSDLQASVNLKGKIQAVLTASRYEGPYPPVLLDASTIGGVGYFGVKYTGSYYYVDQEIDVFFRTSSSPTVNTLISTSSIGGDFAFAISSSGGIFAQGNILVGSGSLLKTDNISSANFPYTQSTIYLRSPLTSSSPGGITLRSGSMNAKKYEIISESINLGVIQMATVNGARSITLGDNVYLTPMFIGGGAIKTFAPITASIISASSLTVGTLTPINISSSGYISASSGDIEGDVDIRGILSLPNIPDVSSSLAAAIEGAGNLETVLTNGNTSTLGIIINGSITAFSASGGYITSSEAWFESGSNIGPAEDGAYTDGAFTFTEHTKIGAAIDKMNEALGGLIPAEAPDMQYLGDSETGFTSAKMNFVGVANYRQLSSTGSLPSITAGESIPGNTSGDGSGGDYDMGIYNGVSTFNVDTVLNKAVTANGSPAINYSASAFGKANEGTLKAYLNTTTAGTPAVTLDLTSTSEATSSTTNGVTISVTPTASGYFGSGVAFPSFVNRTGSVQVTPAVQVSGSNTLIIVHNIGASNYTTNYIRWVNGQDATLPVTSSAGATIDATGDETTNPKYLSGVKYHKGYYATYSLETHNLFDIAYSDASDGITAEVINNSLYRNKILSQSTHINLIGTEHVTSSLKSDSAGSEVSNYICDVPNTITSTIFTHSLELRIRGGNTAVAEVSGSLVSDNNDANANIGARISEIKLVPDRNFNNSFIKTNICQATSSGWLIDNRNPSNNSLQREVFVTESYRVIPGDYDTQASVTNAGNRWIETQTIIEADASPFFKDDNYTASLLVMPRWTSGGYSGTSTSNGMLVYPSNAVSVPFAGNFGGITNTGWVALGGNPSYTGQSGDKTYYRYFRNVSGNDLSTFNLYISCWDNTITVPASGSGLTTTEIHISIKHPGGTGWLDAGASSAQNSTDDLTVDGASAYLGTKPTINTSGVNFNISVGNTATPNQVANNEYLLVRIIANDLAREIKEIKITDFE